MKRLFLILMLMCCCRMAYADMVVIVNAGRGVEQLSRDQVINIFLGRDRQFPDGMMVRPLDNAGSSPERKAFYRKLLDKSLSEINTYWARLIFSGRTMPPKEMASQTEIVDKVARDQAAIGYVGREYLNGNSRVKVVYTLPD